MHLTRISTSRPSGGWQASEPQCFHRGEGTCGEFHRQIQKFLMNSPAWFGPGRCNTKGAMVMSEAAHVEEL